MQIVLHEFDLEHLDLELTIEGLKRCRLLIQLLLVRLIHGLHLLRQLADLILTSFPFVHHNRIVFVVEILQLLVRILQFPDLVLLVDTGCFVGTESLIELSSFHLLILFQKAIGFARNCDLLVQVLEPSLVLFLNGDHLLFSFL